MQDRYALVGVAANGQKTTLLINVEEQEAKRIALQLDGLTDYARIEIVPMRLSPRPPGIV